MNNQKYIDHKKFNSKLNYIIRAYGLSGVISEKIKKAIKESEATDVEENVRCKGCYYYDNQNNYCNNFGFDPPSDDFYCRDGSRKDGSQ